VSSPLNVEPPARRPNLAQTVAQQLLDLIKQGRLGPGDRLPSEMELKDAFSVGRSTIREAINGLVALGVVEVRHGHGAFVLASPVAGPETADTSETVDAAIRRGVARDLREARAAMEVAIAQYAAERADEDDLQAIADCLRAAEEQVARGVSSVKEGGRFHLLIAEATRNEICAQFIRMILSMMEERGAALNEQEGYPEWELAAHRTVFEAVSSGDGERARRAMSRHLRDMQMIHADGWPAFRARVAQLAR
jgi:GntR family transcriptional regulator, transcriptional repressor for pyruvate dehydrogenase complex